MARATGIDLLAPAQAPAMPQATTLSVVDRCDTLEGLIHHQHGIGQIPTIRISDRVSLEVQVMARLVLEAAVLQAGVQEATSARTGLCSWRCAA